MADRISGTVEPSIQGGEGYFTFSLDGLSTAKQMEKLIGLTEDLVKRIVGKDAESLKEQKEQTAAINASTSAIESETDARKDSETEWRKSTQFVANIFHGRFGLAIDESSKGLAAFAGVVGFAYGKLENYGKDLGEGLKRGVAGSTFDLAIASKSAGVSVTTFTKALGESGGAFASLGSGATDGAMQFGSLVKSVRLATADVGNLGMGLDEMAIFTAQQTKTAVQQGFKGKSAQDAVIRNSRELGKELDVLASRTGKSVMEMAQAAMKLSQDPIVSNFVRSMKSGNREVSGAIQSFGASMNALFGEMGDKIGQDALQSAISGLPMVITDTGKNMLLAGTGIYEEIERQAQLAKAGNKITTQDQERLQQLVMQTVKSREQELAAYAQIPGTVGDSARQLLKMADAITIYNSEDGKRDRKRADSAKQFNAELRSLQASLQEMAIPLLKAINMIDWASVFQVISYIPRKIAEVMDFFGAIVKSLPEPLVTVFSAVGSILSTFGSVILGVGVLLGMVAVGVKLFNGGIGILGKGLSVLGVTTLPTYITKYAIVNKALDSFTAALMRAGIAAKNDGTDGFDRQRNRGRRKGTGPNPADIPASQRKNDGKDFPSKLPENAKGGKGTGPNPADIPAYQRKTTGKDFPSKLPENAKGGSIANGLYGMAKIGGKLSIAGMATGLAADVTADMLGRDTFWGKVADTIGTAAALGGTGAMTGNPYLAAGGAALGLGTGLYKNFYSDSASSMSGEITSQAATGDNPVLAAQLASIEQQKKQNELMLESINEQAVSNRIATMGLSKDDDLARRISAISFNA
jgi:hypothetical protein